MSEQEKIDAAKKDFDDMPAGPIGILVKAMIFRRYARHQMPTLDENQIEKSVEKWIENADYEEKSFFLWYYQDQCPTPKPKP